MRASDDSQLQRLFASTMLLFAVALLPAAASAQGSVAGWIEPSASSPSRSSGTSIASAVTITRKGSRVAYDDQSGLQPCDKLKLNDASATIRITLINKQKLRLDAQAPEAEIPCDQAGVAGSLAAFMRGVLGGAESRRNSAIATVSRTDSKNYPPSMPALVGERSEIASGERALYVAWKDGQPPFSVQVKSHADDSVLVRAQHVEGFSVRLPRTRYREGRFVLVITDKSGKEFRDPDLFVVAASALPPLPSELKDAAIPAEARTLYYADYLVGVRDGRFTFEAMQQAASISPETSAVREWLRAWSD